MEGKAEVDVVETYHHLPGVALEPDVAAAVAGGLVARFAFERCEQLARDYAHESYFERSIAVIWRTLTPGHEVSKGHLEEQRKRARLVQLALIAVSEMPLPSPQLSIAYE